MRMPRVFSLVDVAILTVVAVALFLPAREMHAAPVIKGDDARQLAVALAEARTIARPGDGRAVEDFARRLDEVGANDWAIEAAVRASERAKESPTRWRALLAASAAFVDRLDVVPALDYANRALAACTSAQEKGNTAACPSWEEIRMELYQKHLDAGVKSGIDPRVDPAGFRRAGESALRQIRLEQHDEPAIGSGHRGSAGSGASATP
ncbi:MAG: hypothetical protein ACM31C_33725 [Acidobacteriota bacterium]